MKKILFVIRSLELGGITTSLINLLEHIEETAKDEFDIDVLTFAQNSGANLPDYVKVLNTTKNLKLAVTPFYEIVKGKKISDIIKRILLMIEVRLIGSDKFFRKELKKIAEYVILDTAPVGVLTDTAVLAEVADAALFVVTQDYANRAAILEGIDQLAESKIYISGCILNGAQAGIGGYGYRQYRYYNKYGDYLYGSHYGEPSKEDLHED